jgi:predicted nucleic acid-binding protein
MTYLLDTCIIADLISPSPDPRLVAWIDSQPEEMIYISVGTLAELKQCIESTPSSKEKARMNEWLTNDLMVRFNGRISEITAEATLKWGELSARIHGQSRTINPLDSLTLALAVIYDHTLVTTNSSVFDGLGIRLINPVTNQ